eukprot:5430326-Lingulodinium_polyedra.AAC.1
MERARCEICSATAMEWCCQRFETAFDRCSIARVAIFHARAVVRCRDGLRVGAIRLRFGCGSNACFRHV